jgi:hypothetical protein
VNRHFIRAWQLVIVLLLANDPVRAASPELRPFNASYSVTSHGFSAGSAEVQLQRLADGNWSYQSRIRASFMAMFFDAPAEVSRSLFSIQDGHVIPRQFTAEDRSSAKDQSLILDWERGRVTGVFERTPVDLPTQPGLLDNYSVQLALMNELMAGRTPQRFVLVEKGRIREYTYAMETSETLRTALGEQRTVVYRATRPGSNKSTLFWCAPDLGYLPLKVERRAGKDVEWSMTVKTLDIEPKR